MADVPVEVAIDLGTQNTRIFLPGHGIVLSEPTVIADEELNGGRRLKAVGADVAPFLTGVEGSIRTVHPLREGIIKDFDAVEVMLRHFIAKLRHSHALPRTLLAIVGVPAGATPFQRDEHSGDIVDQGIILTGGLALLQGLDDVLRDETGLAVSIADEPSTCVVRAMGEVLQDSALRPVLLNI